MVLPMELGKIFTIIVLFVLVIAYIVDFSDEQRNIIIEEPEPVPTYEYVPLC